MCDTDDTGVVYFANFLSFGAQAFEEWLEKNTKLHKQNTLGFPVVHASCDYRKPILRGESVSIVLELGEIKEHSFSILGDFSVNGKHVAKSKIIHAVVSQKTFTKEKIPEELKVALKTLCREKADI